MSDNAIMEGKRIQQLIRSVRALASIFPGDQVSMLDEAPAIYLGSIEIGDIQIDYLQLHLFRLSDGVKVILYVPALNRILGKSLY